MEMKPENRVKPDLYKSTFSSYLNRDSDNFWIEQPPTLVIFNIGRAKCSIHLRMTELRLDHFPFKPFPFTDLYQNYYNNDIKNK